MCGKFTQMAPWTHVVAWSDILAAGKGLPGAWTMRRQSRTTRTTSPARLLLPI